MLELIARGGPTAASHRPLEDLTSRSTKRLNVSWPLLRRRRVLMRDYMTQGGESITGTAMKRSTSATPRKILIKVTDSTAR